VPGYHHRYVQSVDEEGREEELDQNLTITYSKVERGGGMEGNVRDGANRNRRDNGIPDFVT
jgi:hypothetical protein